MPRADFDYQTYLASREWSLLREHVRERSRNRCEHCLNAPQQAVHHLTYERIGRERLDDLLAVCNPCHEFLSGRDSLNPMSASVVVSEALYLPTDIPDARHFLIPIDDAARSAVRQCRGDLCIWCGYADQWWPLFMAGFFRDYERERS